MDDTRKPGYPSYKDLFSHPEMVMALFEEYVPKPIVGLVDLSTLELLNSKYVSEELLEHSDDTLWRVSLRNDPSAYIVVILRFQSSPEIATAIWLAARSSELLLDIAERDNPLYLPGVLPIVLYNGKEQWNVPLDAESLFSPMPDGKKEGCIRQKYILLDECHIPDEELNTHNGLVTQLIKLERAKSLDDFKPIFARLEELLPDPEYASLNKMFALWAESALKCCGLVEAGRTFRNLQEVNKVLGTL